VSDTHVEYRTLMIRDLPDSERPRERLLAQGAQALSEAELLAIVLRTGVRGMSVVALAQHLLRTFGGLRGLARTTPLELQRRVKGLGPAKAAQLLAALELGRRLVRSTPDERPKVTSPDEAAALLMPDMAHLEQEVLRVVLLDTRNHVMGAPTVYKGSVNAAPVRVGELFREAVRTNAAAIIVAHNHPSGDPTPSREDIRLTRDLVAAGRLLDISVLDHIIIGHNRWISLRERGLGFESLGGQ